MGLLSPAFPGCLHGGVAHVAVADRVHLGQLDLVGSFRLLHAVVAALVHYSGVAGGDVGLYCVVGWHVGALVPHVLAVLLLLLLDLLRLLLLHLLGQPQRHCLRHLPHLLLPVVQAAQEADIPHPVFDALAVLVNQVEPAYLLLLASQPA